MTPNNVEQTVAESDPSSLVPVERARQSKLSWFAMGLPCQNQQGRVSSLYAIYRLKLVKHHLLMLTLSLSRVTIDGVNDARFL